ncbi:MAG: indole-3-glycerol phosphate synthase TrpC [Verrucomicrobiota bacterium]
MNKLDEIIAHKRTEIEPLLERAEKLRYAAAERNDFRSFFNALKREHEEAPLSLIAEVKKASPSAGVIAESFDPVAIAKGYAAAGANAISVLTDEKYFQGSLAYLSQIKNAVNLPILRKDFIIHEIQIYEAVVAGADAILLIVAALDQETYLALLDKAQTFQLDVLVEVHNRDELDRALDSDAQIIGVNNRNLKTFEVDLQTTEDLSEEIPNDFVFISESGIKSAGDARLVKACGADAILVGETLMRSDDVATTIHDLRSAD